MLQKYAFILPITFAFMSVTAEFTDGTEGPQYIKNFYDEIHSHAGSHAQNIALLRQTVHQDWEIYPKTGLYCEGIKSAMGMDSSVMMDGPSMLSMYLQMWSTMIPEMTRERFETVMCRYWNHNFRMILRANV